MLYNSFPFILGFLPACLLLYFVAARAGRGIANVVLAALSLAFYAWWDWRNVPILAASVLFNYAIGLRLRRVGAPKALLAAGVVANLALLGFFKYANFAVWNWAALVGRPFAPLAIVLPLGISFFTFTQIAFLVDAWRGEAAELDFARYCLFVTFFPHLIAGPIVHHRELMPQFAGDEARRWNARNASLGIAFFALGLFKKVAIADAIAPWAQEVFKAAGPVDLGLAWRGALAYTMQLYFDFSGYSDMAIGLGLLFNVRLPDNFDAPYRATSIADFWRRWHITLSRFLRDYLYLPLGGNRRGEPRQRFNLMATMLLGGLWHGAGWTFVVWGGYHGVLLAANRAWFARARPMPTIISRPLTFLAVVVGWVFFRADTLPRAGSLLKSMCGLQGARAHEGLATQLIVLGLLVLFVNVAPTTKAWVEDHVLGGWRGAIVATALFIALLCMRTSLLAHRQSEFLYFQF